MNFDIQVPETWVEGPTDLMLTITRVLTLISAWLCAFGVLLTVAIWIASNFDGLDPVLWSLSGFGASVSLLAILRIESNGRTSK